MIATTWIERSVEQARLLNPAFLGSLVWSCAKGYAFAGHQNQPYAISFLVAPIVLHKRTRECLPSTTRTSLVAWLDTNTDVHVGFHARATALVPLVKEAILFASSAGMIQIREARVVATKTPTAMAKVKREASSEVIACMKKAEFVGKWFARSGDYGTVMALWGVAP